MCWDTEIWVVHFFGGGEICCRSACFWPAFGRNDFLVRTMAALCLCQGVRGVGPSLGHIGKAARSVCCGKCSHCTRCGTAHHSTFLIVSDLTELDYSHQFMTGKQKQTSCCAASFYYTKSSKIYQQYTVYLLKRHVDTPKYTQKISKGSEI